jgi:hypothetical protein
MSLNMYLLRYLHDVILGFMLSFCANSSSFVFNHFSISTFVGFHGPKIAFYTFTLCTFLPWIPSTQSCTVPSDHKTIFWLYLLPLSYPWVDPGLDLNRFQQNPQKLSALLVNQKVTLHTGCTMQSHPR